jgi:hypothetical protein
MGGCLAVGFGLLLFIALVSFLAGLFFYWNFYPLLTMVRNDVQPPGERFIRLLDQGSFQPAYGYLTENCRKEWPPERFGPWATELEEQLGRLQTFAVLAQPTIDRITQTPLDQLKEIPMFFPCIYDKGTCQFELLMQKEDEGWRIARIQEEIEIDKRFKTPQERPKSEKKKLQE